MYRLLHYTLQLSSVRTQQFSGDGVNFLPVELNFEEIVLAIEGVMGMHHRVVVGPAVRGG
jgi:hypothetical protein